MSSVPTFVEPERNRSRWTISLPPFAVEALRAPEARQLEERPAASRWEDHDLVFPSTVLTPMGGNNVTHRLQALPKKHGLPKVRFCDLRHTCANLHLLDDCHPRVVMELLGHSQIALAMDTYSHVIPALQREAADRMEALLTGS